MSLYRLSFHGPEESKHVLVRGPSLSTTIQSLFEAFMEPAAKRCLEKFGSHHIEVTPEDIFDEAVDMLMQYGFRRAEEKVAVIAGTKVGVGDFNDSKLGTAFAPLMEHNEECSKKFLKEIYGQVERSLE